MPTTHTDLKSKKYFDATKSFLETELGIHFLHPRQAYCPFHDDKSDSFRIYVNGKDQVLFHCFGACDSSWDVYDLIVLIKGCTFREAQIRFADFLGVKDFQPHKGARRFEPPAVEWEDQKEAEEPDEPIVEIDTEDLTDEHRGVLQDAAELYRDLLLARKDKFSKVLKYLESRGVDEGTIKDFGIGFCPSLGDEEFRGRALLKQITPWLMNKPIYHLYRRTGLLLLLNDETLRGYRYYRLHIDHTAGNPFGVYADFFHGRITFPIYDARGQIVGIIGRRPDKRGVSWLKQRREETFLRPQDWLYGIDKSARGIKEYQTAIIVEGIFDFFAFYNISERRDKPIVVSTLGAHLRESSLRQLRDLGARNLIIAYDQDPAGRNAIMKAATVVKDANITFLGSLKEGEDPADRLKGVLNKISNFAIRHLQKGMEVKHPAGKPVMASFLVQKTRGKKVVSDEILLKPVQMLEATPSQAKVKTLWYRIDSIIPMLSYDSRNRAGLAKKLAQVREILAHPQKVEPPKEERKLFFSLPVKFIEDEYPRQIGDALILHLRLAIEQQTRRRMIRETDETIAGWLNVSKRTIQKYKGILWDHGLLHYEKTGIRQRLSVRYFRAQKSPVPTRVPPPPGV